jgi:hypothetical protein
VKLNFNKHYINKSHTKHYYIGHIFDNFEWKQFINGVKIQNIQISQSSKYRIKSEQCERWYNIKNNGKSIVNRCPNKSFYKSNTGGYFCKQCAKEINKINATVEFNKIT